MELDLDNAFDALMLELAESEADLAVQEDEDQTDYTPDQPIRDVSEFTVVRRFHGWQAVMEEEVARGGNGAVRPCETLKEHDRNDR
jgi:hypothetical protein